VLKLLQRLSEREVEVSQDVIGDISDPMISKIEKSAIVSESHFHYSDKELLDLIHRHLKSKGLWKAASTLETEANLNPTHASLKPIAAPTSNLPSSYGLNLNELADSLPSLKKKPNLTPPISQHMDVPTGNSFTLDSIMTQYLKDQHSHCSRPVSVLPNFALTEPHKVRLVCETSTSRM
jgi:HIV-1 Vpr-binding protein